MKKDELIMKEEKIVGGFAGGPIQKKGQGS